LILLQIELSPTLIERSGINPSGFYHVIIRARFFGERFYPSFQKKPQKQVDLNIRTTSLSLIVLLSSLLVEFLVALFGLVASS
jgi:hypothetical protein